VSLSPSAGPLEVRRGPGFADGGRSYLINCDAQLRAKVRRNESVELELEPGPRQIAARIDWCRSKTLDVLIVPGRTTALTDWAWQHAADVHAVPGLH
jgi:hypothetical protein